jgi:hypothetical protein
MTIMRPERASWGVTWDDNAPHQIRLVNRGKWPESGIKCGCTCGYLSKHTVDTEAGDHWTLYALHLDPARVLIEWAASGYENCWEYIGLPERLFHRWLDGTL